MRILFIHISKGIINRGSEISTDYLASFLAKRHEVYFFQAGKTIKGKKFLQQQIKLPFKVDSGKGTSFLSRILERLYLSLNDLKILYFSLKLLPELLKKKFDILIPTNGFWQVLVCKLVRLLKGSKIIVFGRAGIGFHDKDNLRLKPDLFIALTKYAKSWAAKINPQANIVYLPNGIDGQFYNPDKKPLIKKSMPLVLTVAALTKYKRVDLVIRAVAKIKKKCFLIIAGQGELKNGLQVLGRKLLKDNFIITTFPAEQMSNLYNSCQVFTLASEAQDAFPRVLLEAMSCGKNIVVRDDPIKREVVQGAGFFVDPENTALYAKILENALKANRGNLARKRAKDFAIEKVGLKLEKILINLTSK